jgi:hypothetical protein
VKVFERPNAPAFSAMRSPLTRFLTLRSGGLVVFPDVGQELGCPRINATFR